MILVPFTGIDNHNHNVSFGAALLGSETAESYKWLLRSFQKAMGTDPKVVVTDQDPEMRLAIQEVFANNRHRLCMWHIIKKLSVKVGNKLSRNPNFKTSLCNIVWTDNIGATGFEECWEKIMNEFNLRNNKWLCDMYNMRIDWIPAYYRHEHMSGLMRTASRSESENHFFGQFTNVNLTLVEFLSHFETAIESQRFQHRKNDHDTRYTTPDFKTEWVVKREVDKIYTRELFYDVQQEIRGSIKGCLGINTVRGGDFGKFTVKELNPNVKGLFEVLFRESDMVISCNCNRYEQYGLLCRHIFFVLHVCPVNKFPSNYVMRRWTRDAVQNTSNHAIINRDGATEDVERVKEMVKEIMKSTEYVVNRLVSNFEELTLFRDQVKEAKTKADSCHSNYDPTKQKERYASILNHDQNTEAPIGRPIGIKTKESGSQKRFKSIEEQVHENPGKKKRTCLTCGRTGHNSRSCTQGRRNGDEGPSN